MNLLVVDDDPKFLRTMTRGLGQTRFCPVTAPDAGAALELLDRHPSGHFGLLLLDIMMPGDSGWDLLATLRERGDMTPVIFVSARDAVDDRVKGLQLGADDYIIKPFAFQELLARIDAVLRRKQTQPALRVADLNIDLVTRRVTRGEHVLDLTPKEFDVLVLLVRNEGRIIARDELRRLVWDLDFDPGTNIEVVHIYRLRRKLDRVGPPMIETVRGEGYRLTASGRFT